jgi:modulator of FtsH protease
MSELQGPFGAPQAAPIMMSRDAESVARIAFLRRVYSLFLGALGVTALGAYIALNNHQIMLWFAQHFFYGLIIYFGAFFACKAMINKPGLNLIGLGLFGAVTGLILSPLLAYAIYEAGGSMSIITNAFVITGAAFAGLTGYVLVTKKDFSFMGAALSIGLFLVIGALISNFFIGGDSFGLAISIVGVVLFAGYILYDTSRILKEYETMNPISGALHLYLDFVNLFIFILRIILASRR